MQIVKQHIIDLYRDAVSAGISLDEIDRHIVQSCQKANAVRTRGDRRRRLLPMVIMTLGSVMIANSVWPIISYMIFVAPALQQVALVAPVPEAQVLKYSENNETVQQIAQARAQERAEHDLVKPIVVDQELDYTNLANWFGVPQDVPEQAEARDEFFLDIPSLNVEKAAIKIGGTDLNSGLIQYPTTAEPGDIGAPVIFGHSVLPQFYRPQLSNPNRYKSIFTKLSALREGDEILVYYNGSTYHYEVQEKHDVAPEDPFILEQRLDARQLKLVTCTPAGTYLRRLVVVAQLIAVD